MSERSHGLQAWVQRLNEAELPALAIVVSDLHRLTQEADASVRQLADVLLRDAALTSKVLRVANSSYYNPSQENIKTISRAIVLIGFDSVRLIGLSVSLIDQLLARASREQLQELLARSFHAAVQARNIAGYVLVRDQEEVFIAALLHDLGELAIWGCGGEQADELVVELARPGSEREATAQRVLGTSFRQLTQGLIRSWNLGDLASLAAASPGSKDPGVRAVSLGARISQAALGGWDCPAMEALVRETAAFTGVSEEDALQQILASADEAIDVARTFGAGRLCDLIPHTDLVQIRVQQEQRKARLLQPDPALTQRALQDLGMMASGGAGLEPVLDSVLDGLHRGVGLERVMLAVLAEGQTSFRVRRAVGEGTQGWMEGFRLPVEGARPADIFSYVLRQRQAIWMGVPASYSLDDLVTDGMRQVLGRGMFFVAPVMAGSRPIGVLYADSRCSGRALKHEQFVAFQRFTQLTGRCLEALGKPR
ncbi:HDOD domain-containing protein [Stutzerimonas azotifigens]|uniref:HDOD domain-containing protein n=1 Tax=Stutzerimonas azotifigens TaxID=291995 RepID=UPI0004139BD6|nr:HDOD domain-containing protein [Stutzerimonas azotifigens]